MQESADDADSSPVKKKKRRTSPSKQINIEINHNKLDLPQLKGMGSQSFMTTGVSKFEDYDSDRHAPSRAALADCSFMNCNIMMTEGE